MMCFSASLMLICLCTGVLSLTARAQGMEFFQGTWEETLAEAQKRGVPVFVDAYTTWCGPCKRMAAEIFPQKPVGEFYNPNFVNVKIDMESQPGLKFKRTYPVRSYPTFFFIAPDGAVISQVIGAKPVDQFIAIGQDALKKYDGAAKYQRMYDEGDRSFEVVYPLVTALNKAGKSSMRIANDYLKSQTDLRTPDNLKLILEAFTHVDSKMYEYFTTYHKDLVKTLGADAVNARLRSAAQFTASRAVEFETESLLHEATAAMTKYLPAEAEMFSVTASMDYAAVKNNTELYLKNVKLYLKKHPDSDAERLHGIAHNVISRFSSNKELVSIGEKAAKSAVTLKDTPKYNITYATLIYLQGDKSRANTVIDEAITRLKANGQKVDSLIALKNKLGST